MFAAESRRKWGQGLRPSRWRWHPGEVLVRIHGIRHYLWRAVDHEGSVLEALASQPGQGRSAEVPRKADETARPIRGGRHSSLSFPGRGTEGGRGGEPPSDGPWVQHPGREFTPALPTTRAMQRFQRMRSLPEFAAAHAAIFSCFDIDRSLSSRNLYRHKQARAVVLVEWRGLCAT